MLSVGIGYLASSLLEKIFQSEKINRIGFSSTTKIKNFSTILPQCVFCLKFVIYFSHNLFSEFCISLGLVLYLNLCKKFSLNKKSVFSLEIWISGIGYFIN